MITARGLGKTYGATTVLAGLMLDVARGEYLHVAGSTGSGRTTLLRILAALSAPTSGQVDIDGHNVVTEWRRVRRQVVYCDNDLVGGAGLSVCEYLRFVAAARGARDTSRPMALRARLDPDAPIDELRVHERTRLALAAAFATHAEVILLDNPLHGIDAEGRAALTEWVGDALSRKALVVATVDKENDLPGSGARRLQMEAGRLAEPGTAGSPRTAGGRL